MSELLNRQIERLESAIELSKDWLEIQYLMAELDQLKDLYDDQEVEAAWWLVCDHVDCSPFFTDYSYDFFFAVMVLFIVYYLAT